MLRLRNSISKKLFAAILAVVALIIIFVAVVLTFNMRTGFSSYLAQA